MTVPSRGAKNRRGGSKPAWQLLTALLVLAILASATLVFTSRVELLRLAVILSLWAAVLAAFVTVIYRRQSDIDQARARDMKFVYDLQLDREIAARREYEMSVEAHLRRQLAHEVRAQAADEMAALRAELASLRGHLEAMLGADLSHRPALGSDRIAEPVAMVMPPPPGRVESSRVTVVEEVTVETVVEEVVESHIIDVPEEPLVPPTPPPTPPTPPTPPAGQLPPEYRGSHRRGDQPAAPQPPQQPAAPPPPPVPPAGPWRPPETQPRRGRHWTPESEVQAPSRAPRSDQGPAGPQQPVPPRGRHWVDESAPPAPAPKPETAPAKDDAVAEDTHGQHSDGQAFADLMARLQANGKSSGGGRRRRKD